MDGESHAAGRQLLHDGYLYWTHVAIPVQAFRFLPELSGVCLRERGVHQHTRILTEEYVLAHFLRGERTF
jgi:hypothetical protein